jgi:hypothetical protein
MATLSRPVPPTDQPEGGVSPASTVVEHAPRFAEIAGWYGMLAILGAFALNSFSVVESSGLLYQLINASGAIGLMIIAYYKRVRQNVILNAVWLAVAVITIVSGL